MQRLSRTLLATVAVAAAGGAIYFSTGRFSGTSMPSDTPTVSDGQSGFAPDETRSDAASQANPGGTSVSEANAAGYAELRARLSRKEGVKERKQSIGGDRRDDPGGRAWQQWLQLRDPATGEVPRKMRVQELAFAARMEQDARAARSSSSDGSAQQPALVNWTNRGIFNLGGRTRALALDISDPSYRTLIAGGMSGGVWRTTNDGESWNLVTGDVDLYSPSCIVQDTRAGRTQNWYVGTGEFLGNSAAAIGASYFGTGIYKSSNGGQSWSKLPATDPGSPTQFDSGFDYVWNVAIDVSNTGQDELYAATIGGVQRSTNGGQSWDFVRGSLGQTISYHTDVAVNPAGIAYVALDSEGPDKGIWRANDGQNFTNINPPGMPAAYSRIALEVAPSNPDVVWALVTPAGQGQTAHKLFKYTASGNSGTWVDRSAQLSALPVGSENNNWAFSSQDGYDLLVEVKPDDENAVFIGGVHLIRSTDQFQSANARAWVGGWLYPNPNQAPFEQHSDQHELVFHPTNPSIAWSGSDGGVWKTTNILAPTVRWTSLNNGYLTTQFYHVAIDEATAGSAVINCGLQDNGCWTAHASAPDTDWFDQFGGDGAYIAVENGATDGGNYYFSSQYSYIYRIKLNAGGAYDGEFRRVDPASLNDANVLFINPIALDPNDTKRMYMASLIGLWRNNDVTTSPGGDPNVESDQGWVKVTDRPNEYVTAIAVSRSPANTVYYAGFDTNARTGRLYKISNASNAPAGTNPTTITGTNFPTGGYINAIAIDPEDANRVLIAFANYRVSSLFYTTNGGTSWTEVEGNLAGDDAPSVRSVLIMPSGSGRVFFAGTSTGLYSTTSLSGGGTTWIKEGAGEIRDLVVAWLVGRPIDGTVVAATHGGGAFSATVGGSAEVCATRGGDANGNDNVDVTDLVAVVNHILETQELSPGARLCTDVAEDGTINVLDLVKIVQIILGAPFRSDDVATNGFWSREDTSEQTSFTIEGEDLAALELVLQLPVGTKLNGSPSVRGVADAQFSWNANGDRVVLLLAPSTDLAAVRGPLTIDVPLAHQAGSVDTEPSLIRLIGASRNGSAILLEERMSEPSNERLAIVSMFPNPTQGPLELKYRTESSGEVRARIITADGRRVRELSATATGSGEHGLSWDGRDDEGHSVATGTYFVRLETNGAIASRRVLVLR